MTTNNESKLKKLLEVHLPGTVSLSPWLETKGISRDLQTYYRRSGWLETVGRGAFKRPSDEVGWHGGLYAMQAQAGLQVHAGALTALAMQGRAHYLRLGRETVFLFSPPQTGLPAWFKGHDWGAEVRHFKTSFLPPDTAMKEYQAGPFPIKISAPERAIMECLHLSPLTVDLVECFQIMEGLAALRPKLLQELLESCGSVKVTRLFLYMADKAAHAWLERLDTSKFDLGSGTRAVTESGVYISKYDMTVPEELAKL